MNNSTVRLTDARRLTLELVEYEACVDRRLVARALFRGNVRTAIAVLKALHDLGLIEPLRICEYKLTSAGQQWLDNHRDIHGKKLTT